jgi:hypothetical protein
MLIKIKKIKKSRKWIWKKTPYTRNRKRFTWEKVLKLTLLILGIIERLRRFI